MHAITWLHNKALSKGTCRKHRLGSLYFTKYTGYLLLLPAGLLVIALGFFPEDDD